MSKQKFMTPQRRIERNCVAVPFSGCWIWTGALDAKGYGILQYNREKYRKRYKKLAHRVAYEAFVGEIPDDKFVCHSCDTPSCVNPHHLWVGTNQKNTSDRVAKGRSAMGERIASSKLKREDIIAIRADSRTHKEIGNSFGVSGAHIGRIKSRMWWKHV